MGVSFVIFLTSSISDSFKESAAVLCCPWEPNLRISMSLAIKAKSSRCGPTAVSYTHLLIVSENGMGKRTYLEEFSVQKRGGKGVKCYKITEKTGYVVGVKATNDDHEIMMITTEGIIIQLRVEDISILGRITSGVKMINLDKGVKVAQIAKVRERVSDGSQEFDNPEDAMEDIPEEERYVSSADEDENLIFPTEEEDE